MSVNDKILEKIRNLLALAEDGANDEESQTALLMAQKLMLKYKISQNDLNEGGEMKIVVKSLSVYKRIYWWEREMAGIIAENFRVMLYLQNSRLPHQNSLQRKIVFMGYPEDVELAYEMYHFAIDAMKHYASLHLRKKSKYSSETKSDLRKSYYQGFMDGLKDKFEKQREDLVAEDNAYALMIQTPSDVVDKFKTEIKGTVKFKQQVLSKDNLAYSDGYDQGKSMTMAKGYLDDGKE